MRIRIITLLSLLHFVVHSQNKIDIYDAMYGNVFLVTLSVSDAETGKLLETRTPQPMEFISGTNDIVLGLKSVLHNDVFHFVEDYYNLIEEKLIFTSWPFMPIVVEETDPIESEPLIKGQEFSLDPASTSQNLIWTAPAIFRGQSIHITYNFEPHPEYTSDGAKEEEVIGTWRLASVMQGDRTETIDLQAENAILQINEDQSFTGFDKSGHYILSGSGQFLLFDNQKSMDKEVEAMPVNMPDKNTLELTQTNDYRNTIIKFSRVK